MKPEKDLLELARRTIEAYFDSKEYEASDEIKRKYNKKQACFITLTKSIKPSELRGCIGSLIPSKKLWVDVQENAINSAFHDYRFHPLTKNELKDVKIEISVLSMPEKLDYKNEKEFLEKLNNNLGVIIKKGLNSATYLPQVWEQISNKENFLNSLCMKAGLLADSWKQGKELEVYVYMVEKIKE